MHAAIWLTMRLVNPALTLVLTICDVALHEIKHMFPLYIIIIYYIIIFIYSSIYCITVLLFIFIINYHYLIIIILLRL